MKEHNEECLTIKEASLWASNRLQKNITTSNISYLIQYGKVQKYIKNGATAVNKEDLVNYYSSLNNGLEMSWRKRLGDDLNWGLSSLLYTYIRQC